jgi:hypothetical protein
MSNANEPDFQELEPLPELPTESPADGPKAAGRGPIEKAPLMLQQAAMVLGISALLPWLVPQGFDLWRLVGKVVVLIGGYVAYCAAEHAHGKKTPLDGVGNANKLALPILSYLLLLVGIGLTQLSDAWQGMIEVSALAVAALAWTQVHGYSLGGKFNPTWALIIPMFGLAALVNIFVVFGLEVPGLAKAFAILGSLGVAGAGGFAGQTMFVSIKEAKAHGEAKKRAASEARMAERRAKRG